MAASTWLAPTLPDEHAAPELTDTPARSSLISSVSADRPGKTDAGCIGQPRAIAGNDDGLRRHGTHGLFQPVPHGAEPAHLIDLSRSAHRGRAEARNADHILRTGPPPALLPATGDQRRHLAALTQDQCAHTRRPADLV